MKRMVDVHRGEIRAGQGELVLESDTNSACLVVMAYDAVNHVGGLAHAVYLSGRMDKAWHSTALPSASEAIDEMIEDMVLVGASRDRIEVSLITGENVPHDPDDPEYQRNLAATVDLLREKGIRFREGSAQDVGLHHVYRAVDGKRTRLNSSHGSQARMP